MKIIFLGVRRFKKPANRAKNQFTLVFALFLYTLLFDAYVLIVKKGVAFFLYPNAGTSGAAVGAGAHQAEASFTLKLLWSLYPAILGSAIPSAFGKR